MLKNTIMPLALCVLVFLASPALCAFRCVGTESGGTGGPMARDYCYEIELGADYELIRFVIGTDDPIPSHYSNIEVVDSSGNPVPGWSGALEDSGGRFAASVKTPHGEISPGSDHITLNTVEWSGTPLSSGTYYMGFDNPLPSQDVEFLMNKGTLMVIASWSDWNEPVGTGLGPVHGPVPEPTMLGLLLMGGLALVRRRH